MRLLSPSIFAAVAISLFGASVQAQKKPLDHSVYDSWNSVQGAKLTPAGDFLIYRIVPQEGDAVQHIRSLAGGKDTVIERGNLSLTFDGKYAVGFVVPKLADTKKAQREKKKPEEMPKNVFTIVNVATGEKTEIQGVQSFNIATKGSTWVFYKPEPPKPAPAPATPAVKPPEQKPAEEKKTEGQKPEEKKDEPKKKADHKPGDSWVLRNLATGQEEKIENVVTSRWTEDGNTLVYVVSTKDGAGDGVVFYDLKANKKTVAMQAMGKYPKLDVHDDTRKVAFVTDKDDYAAKTPALSLYVFDPKDGKTRMLAKKGASGIPAGWIVSDKGSLSFSESGKRVIFATVPEVPEEKKDETPEDEKVSVDIWNWQDGLLQSQQLLQITMENNRTYDAVAFLDTGRILQVEDQTFLNANIGNKNDADFAVARVDKPYQRSLSWLGGAPGDIYLIDLRNGKSKKIFEKSEFNWSFSPTGKYLMGFDDVAKTWMAYEVSSGKIVDATKAIPYPVWDELNDVPSGPSPYGVAGWTKNDDTFYVYDKYDLWAVDPSGKKEPVNVTNAYGRGTKTALRRRSLDPEEEYLDPAKPWLYQSLNEQTKATGYYTDSMTTSPERLVTMDKKVNVLDQADENSRIVFTQQTFTEFPDLWVTDDLKFGSPKRMSDANPQFKDYSWGTEELVSYTSLDGIPLQGMLFKPENMEPGKRYPMIAYFYERDSDTFHTFRNPAPSASTVNIAMYVSNGYVVFVPDIPYKIGYPGESAINAILPGCQEVIRKGFVDPKRVGIQGQSWGGYQVAYMITESNMFAAACAGAPVSNMFSAYGGIRWGSGLVRQMQYEHGQSRIDGTPWNSFQRYMENSPIFYADKVQTPLLIMHNDKDGAVPWWQSIEYFTALRRLDKPVWMAVYNNEDHNLVQRKNRKDWSIRMQQFFDHYLKGAPQPVWMKDGVPAAKKGKTYGFEVPEEKKAASGSGGK
jgi:dipeptidyl aminopeptidase/acylaminoacyl peptidase